MIHRPIVSLGLALHCVAPELVLLLLAFVSPDGPGILRLAFCALAWTRSLFALAVEEARNVLDSHALCLLQCGAVQCGAVRCFASIPSVSAVVVLFLS